VNPSQIERILISSIKDTSHLLYLQTEHNLNETSFVFFPEEAQYIFKYTREYNEAPPSVIIEAQFPEFDYAPAENFEVLADEFKKSYVSRIITVAYGNARNFMDEKPIEAASYLIQSLEGLIIPTDKEAVELTSNPMQWYDEYMKRVAQRDSEGFLSLGIDALDDKVFLTPGQYIGILADWGVGKSYVAVKMATTFYQQGKKILFISPELSRSELMIRFHTILGRQWGYSFSSTALLWGLPTQKTDYLKFLKELESRKDSNAEIIVYDTGLESNLTVEYIAALIQKHKPDVIFVDSIQFIQDTSGVREGWMQIGKVCSALKAVARTHEKIIVATNQTNASGDSAYSREFPRYVDLLIRVSPMEDRITGRNINVDKVRNGPPIPGTLPISFDVDFGEIGSAIWSTADSPVINTAIS